MRASEGQTGPEEVAIIRRVLAGSIASQNYPQTVRRRKHEDVTALASWENEGGAVAALRVFPVMASFSERLKLSTRSTSLGISGQVNATTFETAAWKPLRS